MQLILSFILSLGGIQLYFVLLHFGIYRRYPIETYVLMLLGALIAIRAARKKRKGWVYALASLNGILCLFIMGWTLIFSRLPDRYLPFHEGQALPSIVLVDQDNHPFSSDSLKGRASALYLFYRGDW
jgi:hypothetical protein